MLLDPQENLGGNLSAALPASLYVREFLLFIQRNGKVSAGNTNRR
jgi:hypothetical protein